MGMPKAKHLQNTKTPKHYFKKELLAAFLSYPATFALLFQQPFFRQIR